MVTHANMNALGGQEDAEDCHMRPAWRSINSCIVAAACLDDPTALLATIQSKMEDMNLVNLATSWHRLAKVLESPANVSRFSNLSEEENDIIVRLANMTVLALREQLLLSEGLPPTYLRGNLQSVSNITWALGVLRWCWIPLVDALVQWHERHLNSFLPFEVGSAAWAFTRCSFEHGLCEERAENLIVAASVYLAKEALTKTGFRALVMITWSCAVRKSNLRLVTDIFLPKLKPMLMKADLTAEACLELVEAFSVVCSKMARRKFCWNDIVTNTVRSLQSARWLPSDTARVACAFFKNNIYIPDLASHCQRYFLSNEIPKDQFLEVLHSCCVPPNEANKPMTALPQLRTATADGLMTLLDPFPFPWRAFNMEELTWLASLAECRLAAGPQRGQTFNIKAVQKQAREFIRTAAGYLLYSPSEIRLISGEGLLRMVATYATLPFPGDRPLQDMISGEVIRRVDEGRLTPATREALNLAARNSAHHGYEAIVVATQRSLAQEDPLLVGRRTSGDSSNTSRPCFRAFGEDVAEASGEASTDMQVLTTDFKPAEAKASVAPQQFDDFVPEINWCTVKNSFLEFGHVEEATAAPAPVLEFVLIRSSWLEVTDWRMQYQYYGLV